MITRDTVNLGAAVQGTHNLSWAGRVTSRLLCLWTVVSNKNRILQRLRFLTVLVLYNVYEGMYMLIWVTWPF